MTIDDADQLPTARLNAGKAWAYDQRTGRRRRFRTGHDVIRDGEAVRARFMVQDTARGGNTMQMHTTDPAARRAAVTDRLGDAVTAGQSDSFIDGAYRGLFPDATQPAGQVVIDRTIAAAGIEAALQDHRAQTFHDAEAVRTAMLDDERIRKGLPKLGDHNNPAEAAAAEGELAALRSVYEENMQNRWKGNPQKGMVGLADKESLDPRGNYCRRMANAWKTGRA